MTTATIMKVITMMFIMIMSNNRKNSNNNNNYKTPTTQYREHQLRRWYDHAIGLIQMPPVTQ